MNSITRLYSTIWMGVCGILMKISNVEVHSIINILDNYHLHVIRAECNFSVLKKHLFFHRVSKEILFSKHNFEIIWFSGLFWHFCSPDHHSQDFFVEKFQFWNFFFSFSERCSQCLRLLDTLTYSQSLWLWISQAFLEDDYQHQSTLEVFPFPSQFVYQCVYCTYRGIAWLWRCHKHFSERKCNFH